MIETEIDIQTADGAMPTFITRPESDGPHPVIFFYMDAPGKREELHDMARRIGTQGYYVMLPQLYYRSTREFELDFKSEDSMNKMWEYMHGIGNRMVVSDTQAMIDHAEAQPSADASRIGCVGYCMSGPFSLCVAGAYPDRVKAAASVYGVRLAVDADDSPHLGFANTKGELYIACAEHDDFVPPEMVERVTQELAASGANGRVEMYYGNHHGFAFPGRGPIYDKAAAERHWERLNSLFARNLR